MTKGRGLAIALFLAAGLVLERAPVVSYWRPCSGFTGDPHASS